MEISLLKETSIVLVG